MEFEKSLRVLGIGLFAVAVLNLSTVVLLYLHVQSVPRTIHIRTVDWEKQSIPARTRIEGYVANWTLEKDVEILRIAVWMGKPYNPARGRDLLWEGDTFVTLSNTIDPWSPPTDMVLSHYQFDSHAPSPLPHIMQFDLPNPGFHIDAGRTLYVFRLFNNFDEDETAAGDGWVMFYYALS